MRRLVQANALDEAVGNALRAARRRTQLSQTSLAERAGVHRTYISLLERGRKSATVSMLYKLCKALNIRVSKLLQDAERQLDT